MKQYHRYQMDFESSWLHWSAICVGVAMFLRVIYFLGLQYLEAAGALIWSLWIPLGLGLVYVVLLRGIRLNTPLAYALIGVMMCLCLLVGAFTSGHILKILLGSLGYLACCGILVICVSGYLPGRLPAAVCFGILLGCRVLLFDLGRIDGMDWMITLADWASLASLMCLPMGMVPGKEKA